MSHWHGCQDPVIDFLDERVAKALSHGLRRQILERLSDHGVASPSALADALGEPLGNISYHVRILRDLGCVELVRTEPRRGALEHFYRATTSPWIDDERWAQLPAAFRRTMLAPTLEAAARASQEGGFDGPEAHVSRAELALDEAGRVQLAALLGHALDAVRRIHAESVARLPERAPDAPPIIATELVIVHVRHQTS